jgi:LPS O-antigen subunit length determinant protein (WzzB/FepE family)
MEEFARQMESQLGEVQTELQGLREEIAKKSFDRKLLNLQETPQLRSYDLLSGMLEQAKFVESDQLLLGDIKVLSDPVLPDRKSWPPRSLFVLLAGMGGLFVSTALVLLRTALGSLQLTRA